MGGFRFSYQYEIDEGFFFYHMEQLDYVSVMFSLIMQLSCFGVFVVPIGEVHRSMLGPSINEPSIPLDS